MPDYPHISLSLQRGKHEECKKLVEAGIAELKAAGKSEGDIAKEILSEGLLAGMSVIGEKFKHGVIYIPNVLLAARAMKTASGPLKPLLTAADIKPTGRVIVGTVKGDLHDIGKNLVVMMLEGAGFQVTDLGVDVPSEKFVAAAKEGSSDLIALSALPTTTMPRMAEVVKALGEAGAKVKVMIGGAPVTQAYAREIGADGYAPDAASAATLAKSLASAN